MTPEEIAEVRPRLLDFAAEMPGVLPRKDQRAAGELYVRGLLTDGQRKSMQPMAARLGVDHQRLQQFITSSTWDYTAGRRNVARRFPAGQPAEAGGGGGGGGGGHTRGGGARGGGAARGRAAGHPPPRGGSRPPGGGGGGPGRGPPAAPPRATGGGSPPPGGGGRAARRSPPTPAR